MHQPRIIHARSPHRPFGTNHHLSRSSAHFPSPRLGPSSILRQQHLMTHQEMTTDMNAEPTYPHPAGQSRSTAEFLLRHPHANNDMNQDMSPEPSQSNKHFSSGQSHPASRHPQRMLAPNWPMMPQEEITMAQSPEEMSLEVSHQNEEMVDIHNRPLL